MEPIFQKYYTVQDSETDCFGRLRPDMVLFYAQEAAADHCIELGADGDTLAEKGLFWAVIRHKIQVERLPERGETLLVETWPMPTTRVAYPRATVAYDREGRELFRIMSLWVLMDVKTRAMILPGKSGVGIQGLSRGGELATPGSLAPQVLQNKQTQAVRFSDLDRNGHMNNCKYLQWAADLLQSSFHRDHPLRELTLCYLSEAREAEVLTLHWQLSGDVLQVETVRENGEMSAGHQRVFAAQILFQ